MSAYDPKRHIEIYEATSDQRIAIGEIDLRPDHTPVGAADGDRGRTRAAARGSVGPGADGLRVLRVVARWVVERQFAWMLHVDEKRAQVWRVHHSRDLAFHGRKAD